MDPQDLANQAEGIVGFSIDDISKVQPFKDVYSTAWFVTFMIFIGAIGVMIAFAFLYSFLDCLCCCCGARHKKRRVNDSDVEIEMDNRKRN